MCKIRKIEKISFFLEKVSGYCLFFDGKGVINEKAIIEVWISKQKSIATIITITTSTKDEVM